MFLPGAPAAIERDQKGRFVAKGKPNGDGDRDGCGDSETVPASTNSIIEQSRTKPATSPATSSIDPELLLALGSTSAKRVSSRRDSMVFANMKGYSPSTNSSIE